MRDAHFHEFVANNLETELFVEPNHIGPGMKNKVSHAGFFSPRRLLLP